MVAVGCAVSRAAAGADGVGEGEVDAPTAAGVAGVVGAAEVTGAAEADVRAGAAEVSVAAVAVPAPVTGAATRPAVTSTARARCGPDAAGGVDRVEEVVGRGGGGHRVSLIRVVVGGAVR